MLLWQVSVLPASTSPQVLTCWYNTIAVRVLAGQQNTRARTPSSLLSVTVVWEVIQNESKGS
jgi:hypothetical protein